MPELEPEVREAIERKARETAESWMPPDERHPAWHED